MSHIEAIVEHVDCTDEQKKIKEINTGIYVISNKLLYIVVNSVLSLFESIVSTPFDIKSNMFSLCIYIMYVRSIFCMDFTLAYMYICEISVSDMHQIAQFQAESAKFPYCGRGTPLPHPPPLGRFAPSPMSPPLLRSC